MTGLILAIARAAGEWRLMLVGVVKLAPTLPMDGNFPVPARGRKFMLPLAPTSMMWASRVRNVEARVPCGLCHLLPAGDGDRRPQPDGHRHPATTCAKFRSFGALMMKLTGIAGIRHLRETFRSLVH